MEINFNRPTEKQINQYFELGMIDKETYERWKDSRMPHFEEDEEEPHICQTCESDEGLCQVCYERKNTAPICNRCGEPIGLTASVVYEDDDSKVYCGPCRAFIVAHKQYLYWL